MNINFLNIAYISLRKDQNMWRSSKKVLNDTKMDSFKTLNNVFTEVELATLEKLLKETREWMGGKKEEQSKLAENQDPAFVIVEIKEKTTAVEREVKYLLNKMYAAKLKAEQEKLEKTRQEQKLKDEAEKAEKAKKDADKKEGADKTPAEADGKVEEPTPAADSSMNEGEKSVKEGDESEKKPKEEGAESEKKVEEKNEKTEENHFTEEL